MGVLDSFRVVLLDMNGTFMFGGDLFSDNEDFATETREGLLAQRSG